jgi:hypothetical protein
MAELDYECKNGHVFQRGRGRDTEKCPKCKTKAEIIWLSPSSPHRQLQTPIVMWEYADGTVGVAGGANSKTPKGAHRREIRSLGEYRQMTKKLNAQFESTDRRREESYLEQKQAWEAERRSQLSHLMGQEKDPAARDLYREALERGNQGHGSPQYREYFSIPMEMDKSNYE